MDWKRTLQLWEEDEEARNEKTLVRKYDETIFYPMYFVKKGANYRNKGLMKFNFSRYLGNLIRDRIQNGTIEAFKQ